MTDIVPVTESGSIVGLEDIDLSEGGTPRITIDHTDAVFRDTMSGVAVAEFSGIVLGLVKQRVLWPPEVGDEPAQPLCKSVDFKTGRPNVDTFPLAESKLTLTLDDGVTASCEDCALKDWDTHPTRQGPWCQEQHVWAVLADLEDDGNAAPALLTFQRSSMKPSRQYLGAFARKRQPSFSVVTHFKLNGQKRGSVKYAVPELSRGEATDPDDWSHFGEQYLSIRGFLQTVRSDEESSDTTASKTPKVERDDEEIPEF